MEIGFKPFHFAISKTVFSLSIFGIIYTKKGCTIERSIGFSFRKEKLQDRSNWMFRIFLYGYIKAFLVKTILDSYYIRCNCGRLRWKHNGYCSACYSESYDTDDYTFVYRDLEEYVAAKLDKSMDNCKVEYEYKLK